jgi:hypothetical protein
VTRAHRGRALKGKAAVADAIGHVGGVPFGAVLAAGAALRRGKVVHPHGVVFSARLVMAGAPAAPRAAALLSEPAEHRALVRFSRALGLPQPLPDLLGMSIRVLDAYGPERHQDLLLVTSLDWPVVHHIFLPARDTQQRPYTSSLPFQAGDERFIVGALPVADSPRPTGGDDLTRVRNAAATGRLRFELAVAPIMGRFLSVGELLVGAELPPRYDALRFEPWRGGGGLEPVGVINAMRPIAYPLADRAWRARAGREAEVNAAGEAG